MIDKHMVEVQNTLNWTKTTNANANLNNATGLLAGVLADFGLFETVQDGELVSA